MFEGGQLIVDRYVFDADREDRSMRQGIGDASGAG